MRDRFSDRALAKLVESINRHLPQRRVSLKTLLEMDSPAIRARDGEEYDIERDELEFIARYVDEYEWDRFSIPIILEMRNLGSEYVIYVRDRRHAEFIEKAFGFDRYVDDVMLLYVYEMQRIRRRLKTASQVMFRV
ncbi:Uncharacterized protein conserved in archaea [Geoglobus ahangari]|uniref:Uncharacterized protein conserved in archaea n=1 Tax=Geoglobus ahangari TaxID=113653 RepID=A0A0F7IFZ3_9EURY|nr:DUF61 family protein [Geoglobus ahangari]AKG91779.1 Uncharacterized protein conserved in archaea [Geoglobus ahangari]NOY10651.1 DUF61 family protein [Archaeoglobi archaeon]